MTNATQTTAKRNTAIKATVRRNEDGTASGLSLDFSHGKQLLINAVQLTDAIRAEALIHGLKQKLVDAAAISRNPDTGRSATIDDKYAAVRAVYDRLLSGLWNEPREGGGNVGGLLFKALCRMQPAKTPEDIKAWLDGKDDKQKAALRANAKVAAMIAEIQAEAARDSGIDSDELLDELGD
jgi:hypothetical protein